MEQFYEVNLCLRIRARTPAEAWDKGLEACNHLQDTFNDDGSISPFVTVQVGGIVNESDIK